jgi:CubicO group peptidase (beta-lactamase class C family)
MNTDNKNIKEINHQSLNKIQSKHFQTALIIAFYICVHLCSSVDNIFAQSLPIAAPSTVGMSTERLNEIDKIVAKDIADKKLPGAVVLIGRKGKIVYRKAFGNRSLVPTVEKMTVDTIFDVASLTKPWRRRRAL